MIHKNVILSKRHWRQLLRVMAVLVILRNLSIWKHILTSQYYKQLKGFPWQMKIAQLMAAVRWKVRKGAANCILSHERSDKISSSCLTKCKRNEQLARYHRKQCPCIKKFRNKLITFQTFVSAFYVRKIT